MTENPEELILFIDMMSAQKGAAQNTLDAYERDIFQFLSTQNITPCDIKASDIASFVQDLTDQKRSVKTIARKLSAVREFCKFLIEEKILKQNPLPDICPPKKEKPLPKFLRPEDVEKLYNAGIAHEKPHLVRAAVMIKLMFASGLRVSEAVCLSLTSISHDKKQIFVKGKGSKERIVFFDEQINKLLFDFIENVRPFFLKKNVKNTYLFASNKSKSGHITRDGFFKNLKELCVLSGVSPALVSPHTLRHSFATNLINHDVSLRAVQKMLGHENISTTQIYTHITQNKIIDDVIKKHPLKDFEV